ncbi:HAD family hydrolase [soil metagenome]
MGRFLDFEGVDAVVFDCDGVLVDSEPVSELAWRAALGLFGVELHEPFSRWVGTTDEMIASHYCSQADVDSARLLDEAESQFRTALEIHGVEVFADAADALAHTAQAGMGGAVATNSQRWRLDALLQAAGLAEVVAVTVTSDDVRLPKPAQDLYLLAADILGVEPSRCLVVEDSPTGITSARAAGMRVVAIDRGVFDQAELAPATRVVESLAVISS